MATQCAQCGAADNLRRGRCGACGAAVDIGDVARHARRAALLRAIGGEWYWWIGELVALAVAGLVVLGALPLWTLAIAGVLLLRPLSRLIVLLLRGGLDQMPG